MRRSGVVLAAILAGAVCAPSAPASADTCSGVQLSPSQDVATVVNKAKAATTFCFAPGVYRLSQTLKPRAAHSLVGAPGAVLSGARVVASWQPSGSQWVASGQTQGPTQNVPPGPLLYPQSQYLDNLYLDGAWLWKVGVKLNGTIVGQGPESVGPGQYFFDYDADQITLGSDPTGHLLEASVVPTGIDGTVAGLRVSGLTVEMFSGTGINARAAWTVTGNEALLNATVGVHAVGGTQVVGNSTHHNGQYGINGQGANVLVDGNDVGFNDAMRLRSASGNCVNSGGSKFVNTTGLVVRGNTFHDNLCKGLWLDICNDGASVTGNTVAGNQDDGITQEIGYNATIAGNTVAANAGTQIMVRASSGNVVSANTIASVPAGQAPLILYGATRTDHPCAGGPHLTRRNQVHDNDVTVDDPTQKLGVLNTGDPDAAALFDPTSNAFFHNTYRLPSAAARDTWAFYRWSGAKLTAAQWQAVPQDADGTWITP